MVGETNLIADRIRSLRMAKSLKQADLDVAAKLPRSSISKIENGKREATASEIVRISQVLGVTLDMLVREDSSFVYSEEIKVIEALREISFEDYQRIIKMIEAQVYFASKDVSDEHKVYLKNLVTALAGLSQRDQRPRGRSSNFKRARN